MSFATRYLRKIKARINWGKYTSSVYLHRKFWDILDNSILQATLEQACVFDKFLPTYLLHDDPIFSDPSIGHNATQAKRSDMLTERRSYLYHLHNKVFIEPQFGYVVAEPNSIVDLALPGSELARDKTTMQFFSGIPSWSKLNAARKENLPVQQEKIVATLRFVFDSNYYHFYLDVMSKLKMFDDYGLDRGVPLIISSALAKQPFFKYMCSRGDLSKRNWLVQENFYIQADEIVFAKPDVYDRSQLDYFLQCAEAPQANEKHNRRIFLTRSPKAGRNILNIQELYPLLDRFGFNVVDAAMLPIEKQMSMFSQAECVVAIHGAGLTNMLFRRNGTMKILEILPPSEIPLCFYELSKMYDFEYSCVRGFDPVDTGRHAAFYLDPDVLAKKLNVMCEQRL